jgi:hypothetical protein
MSFSLITSQAPMASGFDVRLCEPGEIIPIAWLIARRWRAISRVVAAMPVGSCYRRTSAGAQRNAPTPGRSTAGSTAVHTRGGRSTRGRNPAGTSCVASNARRRAPAETAGGSAASVNQRSCPSVSVEGGAEGAGASGARRHPGPWQGSGPSAGVAGNWASAAWRESAGAMSASAARLAPIAAG